MRDLADKVLVLHYRKELIYGVPSDVLSDPRVIEAYMASGEGPMNENESEFLQAGRFVDSGHAAVIEFAAKNTAGASSKARKAVQLFYTVRDEIRYDVYIDYTDPMNFRASGVLERKAGFCVAKAALLAASCRAVGIAARVGYADVRNHMSSPRLLEMMQSDVFSWHSYAELFVDGQWLKAVPAFDAALCARLDIPPLEFDARSDALLHAFDAEGNRRMEYLRVRGVFADVPFDTILQEFRLRYPLLIAMSGSADQDFRIEAGAG